MSNLIDILDDLEDAINVIDGTGNYSYDLTKHLHFAMDTPDIESQNFNEVNPKVIVKTDEINIDNWSTEDFSSVAKVVIAAYIKQDSSWDGTKIERVKVLNLQRDVQSAVYQFFNRQRTVAGAESFDLEGSINFSIGKSGVCAHILCEFYIRYEETES